MLHNSLNMNEFDKILHDRLNEEAAFPGLEQHWQELATRLDAPAPVAVGGGNFWRWLLGGAAAVLLLLNTWKLLELQRENAALRQQVAENQPVAPQAAQAQSEAGKVIYRVDTVFRTVYVKTTVRETSPAGKLAFGKNTAPSAGVAAQFLPEKTGATALPSADQNVAGKNAPATAGQIAQSAGQAVSQNLDKTAAQTAMPAVDQTSNLPKAENLTAAPPTALPVENLTAKNLAENSGQAVLEKNTAENQAVAPNTAAQAANSPTAQPEGAHSEPVPIASQPADSTHLYNKDVAEKTPDAASANPTVLPDAKTAEAAQPAKPNADFDASAGAKPIRPNHGIGLKISDFAVGVNYTVGIPPLDEIPAMHGFGFQLEAKFAKHFRAKLTSDRTKFSYRGENMDRRANFPDAPMPDHPDPGHNHFEHIEVDQTRHQIGLHLDYLFGVSGKLQPYLSVGYAWQRIGEQTATFKFRDPGGPHGNETKTKTLPAQVLSANWTAGFGVEYLLGKHVGVGANAEFLGNFDSKTVNLPVVRVGAKYRF